MTEKEEDFNPEIRIVPSKLPQLWGLQHGSLPSQQRGYDHELLGVWICKSHQHIRVGMGRIWI